MAAFGRVDAVFEIHLLAVDTDEIKRPLQGVKCHLSGGERVLEPGDRGARCALKMTRPIRASSDKM